MLDAVLWCNSVHSNICLGNLLPAPLLLSGCLVSFLRAAWGPQICQTVCVAALWTRWPSQTSDPVHSTLCKYYLVAGPLVCGQDQIQRTAGLAVKRQASVITAEKKPVKSVSLYCLLPFLATGGPCICMWFSQNISEPFLTTAVISLPCYMHWLKAHNLQRDCYTNGVISHEAGAKQGLPKVTFITFYLV